jgi:hypothetical protein
MIKTKCTAAKLNLFGKLSAAMMLLQMTNFNQTTEIRSCVFILRFIRKNRGKLQFRRASI